MSQINPESENPIPVGPARRRRGRPVVPIDMQQLQQLRKQNLSIRQIGRLMGISKSGIGVAIRRLPEMNVNASNKS